MVIINNDENVRGGASEQLLSKILVVSREGGSRKGGVWGVGDDRF